MAKRGMGSHHSAAPQSESWATPPFIIEALGGPQSFDLDPCAMIEQPVETARHSYTIRDNGLLLPWYGRVWLNPPYSTALIGKFMGRMAAHGRGVALIFARTETDTFFRFVWDSATAVLFLKGRLSFVKPDGTIGRGRNAGAGAPSVLCAYGHDDADILAFCDLKGQFVPLRIPRFVAALAILPTWSEAVRDWLLNQRGPVTLADIYRAFADHPKTRTNPNWRAKIRQVLQLGPYTRIDRGVWQAAA